MRKYMKRELVENIKILQNTNDAMKRKSRVFNQEECLAVLEKCQGSAIQMGTRIEETEGEGTVTVGLLEQYCELLYQISQVADDYVELERLYGEVAAVLEGVEESVWQDLPDSKREVVFLPYKASMWDSLESVWKAADEDPGCDAYVIPIPYYDKNTDGSFKEEHYEGDAYPDYVPITLYDAYDFAGRRPDAIFIHNPYDDKNYVSSVHPFFYSKNLKQFTDNLIYIPYYSTTGGMSEAQRNLSAYHYADYIVIQSEKYRRFFEPSIPSEKFLALGTPKFDKVLGACKNPPEVPEAWRDKMSGKKVYFYNTSLSGMLADTPAFLKKMEYVFQCFTGRTDACLLWRPHPLMEATFESLRAVYKPVYDALKKYFVEFGLGIYDDTPEMTDAIALSDAYIGDSATSVTSLFGIAGKPLFILDNQIHSAPEADDWRGVVVKGLGTRGNNAWMVTQGNKLYYAPNKDYQYRYLCDLSEYAGGSYYSQVVTIQGKHYVCPANAQDILVVGEQGVERKIQLKRLTEHKGAFYGFANCGRYLFLIPNNYPEIVRYDILTDEVSYLADFPNVFRVDMQGKRYLGGFCVRKDYLFLASPTTNQVLAIHAKTCKVQLLAYKTEHACGCGTIVGDGEDLWILPYFGTVVTGWNPETGVTREYNGAPEGLKCVNPYTGYECEERPYFIPAFFGEYVYLPPCYGNQYVKLNKWTGEMTEWLPPFEQPDKVPNGYYVTGGKSYFLRKDTEEETWLLVSVLDKRLYEVNLRTDTWRELTVGFDYEELVQHESGFGEDSEWLQYACNESAFNSLTDFLDGNITGNGFDSKRQVASFGSITANHDGTCGEKIYNYVRDKIKTD